MSRLRAWTGAVLVFLIGAASGIAVATAYHRKRIQQARRDPLAFAPEAVAAKLRAELGLDPAQSEQLKKITAETRLELRQLQEKTRPQAMEIVQRAGQRLRAFLNPDQAAKFDELRRRAAEERFRSHTRPLPPAAPVPGPPPQSPPPVPKP